MAIITSGAGTDTWTIDATSNAGRATLYNSAGVEIPQVFSMSTFSCTTANFTPAATATDLFTISGSASKIVRVLSIGLTGTATAATNIDTYLIKRSSANSGGTFVNGTAVSHNATNAAATAAVGHYTANAASLGISDGTVTKRKLMLPIAATPVYPVFVELLPIVNGVAQPITLNANTEFLAVNNNSAAIPAGGANWAVTCTWVEI